jgi:hypothetical protein
MNKKENEYWPTILIMEGRPYRLKKLNRQNINDPCPLCDLKKYCNNEKGQGFMWALCTSDDRDDAWFFEEDWTIYDKLIADFVEIRL